MALFVDLVALSNGLHGSVQMDSVALFSWIGWLRHHGILKNGKISQEQAEKYFKYFVVFLLLATFIILAIHVSIYGGALIFPPLM